METQADTVGAQLLLNPHAHFHPKIGLVGANPDVRDYVVRCATIAMALVASLLEINDKQYAKKPSERTHPSAGARFLNMLRFALLARGTVTEGELLIDPKNNPLDDSVATLGVLGTDPLSHEDVEAFLGLGNGGAPSPGRIVVEARELLRRVPNARLALMDATVAAIRSLVLPEGEPTLKSKHPGDEDPMTTHFGHMTWTEFRKYLMESVALAGEAIPWHIMGTNEFELECIRRAAPILIKRHPGVFFGQKPE
jgi:hypothetical protein